MEYFGIWRPTSWTSKWAIRFYNFYNCFMLAFIYYFGLTFLISICQNFDDFDLLTENIFFFSGLFVLSLKITYISIYRENIIAFKNMFLQSNCCPRDIHELAIRKKFHEIDRLVVKAESSHKFCYVKNLNDPFFKEFCKK